MLLKYFKITTQFLLTLCLMFLFLMFSYGESVTRVTPKELHSSNVISDSIKKDVDRPVSIPYNNSVAVTGDSYAGKFCEYEDMKDFFMKKYAIAGRTIVDNESIMIEAAKSNCKILVISIGVNDHVQCTVPYVFEATFRRILNYSLLYEKVVFLHSYADYPSSCFVPTVYKISTYNDIIKRLAKEYPNTHFIDMTGYDIKEYADSDNIHYGKGFYDVMYNKMVKILNNIDF